MLIVCIPYIVLVLLCGSLTPSCLPFEQQSSCPHDDLVVVHIHTTWRKIIIWPPCHRSGAAAYSRRLCISVSFSNIICNSFLPLAGGLPATPFFARLFLILVPFRGHFGEVDLWPSPRQPLHCTWYKPLVLVFLVPLPSMALGILFFLCLPTSLLDRGGKSLKPSSTCRHCDLSRNGAMTTAYAYLNLLTE